MTRGRVLVVDDAPDLRLVMRIVLGDAGFEVLEAEDGGGAIDQLGRELPDAMVLDLRMPVLDGVGVLDWMRDNGLADTVPVVVVTAWADRATGEELQARGCRWLVKPFDMAALVEAVTSLVPDRG